jgi:hypothetical protein
VFGQSNGYHMTLTRRQAIGSGVAAAATLCAPQFSAAKPEPRSGATRGVILYPFDLSLSDWPERAAKAEINTIALHAARRLDVLADFIRAEAGQNFLAKCQRLNIQVEYELHAMGELLSRELYYQDPTLFRLDESGLRNVDANCNPFSKTALDIIAEKAVEYAKLFRPTTGRYFYWPDDGAKWDYSAAGKELSAADQALLVENHIVKALRKHVDPQATLSHISYHHTLAAPTAVKPEAGMFLEFAPILRDYTKSLADRSAKTRRPHDKHPDPTTNGGYLDILETNLKLFGVESAQVLEYWLDVSMFSRWTRPAVKLPWDQKICEADVAVYRKLGLRHVTSFATYLDADYVKRHGDPQEVILAYGKTLAAK